MKLAVLVAALIAAPAQVASAQAPPTDPDAATPAGSIYQLPLDQARVDAAPKRNAAGATSPGTRASSGSGGSQTGANQASALRSENGFGSSSVVPGAEPRDRTAGSGAGPSREARSAKASSGSAVGGASDATARDGGVPVTGSSAPDTKASAAPSSTRVYLLLALVLAVGIAGGMATRVRARGDTPA